MHLLFIVLFKGVGVAQGAGAEAGVGAGIREAEVERGAKSEVETLGPRVGVVAVEGIPGAVVVAGIIDYLFNFNYFIVVNTYPSRDRNGKRRDRSRDRSRDRERRKDKKKEDDRKDRRYYFIIITFWLLSHNACIRSKERETSKSNLLAPSKSNGETDKRDERKKDDRKDSERRDDRKPSSSKLETSKDIFSYT